MKLPENIFSRILLAYLPFLVYPFDLLRVGVAALWTVIFFWITVAFFWFARRLFPERLLQAAFFLWLLVWGQAAWMLTKLQPFWVLSVFLLMPVSFLEEGTKASQVRVFSRVVPQYFWERFLTGAGFILFVFAIGCAKNFLGVSLDITAFQKPAGTLLLLAAAAFVWKNQPYRR